MTESTSRKTPVALEDLMDEISIFREQSSALFELLASVDLNEVSGGSIHAIGRVGVSLSDRLQGNLEEMRVLLQSNIPSTLRG